MPARKINCHVCLQEATETDAPDTSRNVIVTCPQCKRYLVTNASIRYYLDRDDLLDDEDREMLSKYIQERYNAKTERPVYINSVGYR